MKSNGNKKRNIRWTLVLYDMIIYLVVAALLLVLYGGNDKLSTPTIVQQMILSVLCIFATRLIGNIYGQVWRYGGIQCYIRLLFTDAIAFWVYVLLELTLPVNKITFARIACPVLYERSGSTFPSYDVPLRLQMRQSGNIAREIPCETSLHGIWCTGCQ